LIVIDASLMIAWLLEESAIALATELNELFERETLVVPAHWSAEVGNGLVVNLRRGRIPPDKLDTLIEQCSALDFLVETADSVEHISTLARFATLQSLTFYDAAYVQIALERSIPLGTLDKEMRGAAARLGIRLFPAPDR
jgi:predicted nucleic acid-binding protein